MTMIDQPTIPESNDPDTPSRCGGHTWGARFSYISEKHPLGSICEGHEVTGYLIKYNRVLNCVCLHVVSESESEIAELKIYV